MSKEYVEGLSQSLDYYFDLTVILATNFIDAEYFFDQMELIANLLEEEKENDKFDV